MTKLELLYTAMIAAAVLVLFIYCVVVVIKNGLIKKIMPTLKEAMQYAEKNISGSEAKQKYVLTAIEEKCKELGIPLGLTIKLATKLIKIIITNYNVIDHVQ